MSPKIVDKEMKRLEIAVAAGELFGKRGFDKVTIKDVAKAAGIGKGTVYEYFKNKEELINGAFETLMSHMETEVASSIDENLPPLESLKKITESFIMGLEHFGSQYGFFLEYMLHLERTGQKSELLTQALMGFRQLVTALIEAAKLQGHVRKNLNIEHAAAAFIAWFDGVVFHWMILREPSMSEMADAYLDTFLNGIVTKEGVSK